MESIYEWYPIGSITVWRIPRELIEEYNDTFRPLTVELKERIRNLEYLVIDGQQRLVSLLLLKQGTITIEEEGRIRKRRINLYFNPLEQEEKFRLSRRIIDDPEWFSVSDLLNEKEYGLVDDLLEKKDIRREPRRKLIKKGLENFRNRVLNYLINVYEIPPKYLNYKPEEDNFLELFDRISQMFVKLNYEGTRVKMPHLILALLTGRTRRERGESFRSEIINLSNDLEKIKWSLRETVIIRAYMTIATNTTGFRQAKKRIREDEC